jgi:tripartite-type tricarboxylate transporter receptor subunit TctC
MFRSFLRVAAFALALFAFGRTPLWAAEEFYRGKQLHMMIGSDAGSGFDIYARLLARHLADHIPGRPAIVPENLSAAGGVVMSNDVADRYPKDGTYIAAPQSSVAFEQLLHLLSPDGKTARFDATKLNWLGTTTQDVFVVIGSGASPVQNMSQLQAAPRYVVGASGPNTDGSILVALMNQMLGTHIKLVTGYSGASGELLAIERGEIDGAPMAFSSAITLRPNLLTDGKTRVILQMGAAPRADLKGVPFFADLVKSDGDRAVLALVFAKYQMGRPYFVAEGVPADRVALLRRAFDETMRDPAFLADAKTTRLEVSPLDGDTVQKLIARLYAEPDDLVVRTRKLLGTQK